MKKMSVCSLSCCFLFLSFSVAHAEPGLQKISEHVYSYVDVQNGSPANSFGANAGIIIGDSSVAVVDTLISAKEAQRFLADIRTVTDKPVRYVINTHYHLDHSFGNSVFADLGAVIIAQANCAAEMHAKGADTLAGAANYGLTPEMVEGTKLAYPAIIFTDQLSLDLGSGLLVELRYTNPSHSAGSTLVSIPADKVTFAGDILFTNVYPYMGDGDIPGWQQNLDLLESLGADKIIPGHGPLSTIKDVADMRAYLDLFDQKARELVAGPGTVEELTAELKKTLPVRQGDWLIGASLQAKYLAARKQ